MARGLLFVALVSLAGCGEKNSQEKAEFARLSRTLQELRGADNYEKREALGRLRAQGCRAHCELRTRCILAYSAHLEGLSLIEHAKRLIESSSDESDVVALLEEAESKMKKARSETQVCAGMEGALGHSLGR